ncbi:hypothetical protein [Aquimarina sediminis]|uniref:hypothetical protein n=1 Tax=Aquimarina sediminis TaxID=2070536 RepID=UPI000CA05A36|nr:hypothetical protein [Aquimarina sediminis]
MIILAWILGIIAFLFITIYLYHFVPLRGKEEGFKYVCINEDGSVRELTREERGYLTEVFHPTDGARPYIKSRYNSKIIDGKISSGFILRNRVPKKIVIREIESTNENWRRSWIYSLIDLTNLEYQKRTWLHPNNTNPYYSFKEFMSSYFDDLDLIKGYEKHIKSSLITQKEYDAIGTWHKSLVKYTPPNGNDYDNKAILEDEKWKEIIKLGINAKLLLKPLLNRYERGILVESKYALKVTIH